MHPTDSLVLNIQFLYDGDFPGGSCFNDLDEDVKERLCKIQQRRGNG